MAITAYKVVASQTPSGLSDAVTQAITDGFQPYDAISSSADGLLMQMTIQGTPVGGGGGSSGPQVGDVMYATNHGQTTAATGVVATFSSLTTVKLDVGFAIISHGSPQPNLYDGNGTIIAGAAGTYMFNTGNDDIAGIQMTGTTAALSNNATFTIVNSSDAGTHTVTAVVSGGVLSMDLALSDTSAIVDDVGTVVVHNYGGGTIGTGAMAVADGALSNIRMPANIAGVSDGVALTLPVTGVYVSQITPTVVDGSITGFVLS